MSLEPAPVCTLLNLLFHNVDHQKQGQPGEAAPERMISKLGFVMEQSSRTKLVLSWWPLPISSVMNQHKSLLQAWIVRASIAKGPSSCRCMGRWYFGSFLLSSARAVANTVAFFQVVELVGLWLLPALVLAWLVEWRYTLYHLIGEGTTCN